MFEVLLLLSLSFVMVLGALSAAGWLLLSGDLASFDGLLLTFVALLLALVFFLSGLWTVRSQEFQQWWDNRKREQEGRRIKHIDRSV